MKQFYKGFIRLREDLYSKITRGEELLNNDTDYNFEIGNHNYQITFKNGLYLRLTISGLTSHKQNNIYKPINVVYKFELLNDLKEVIKTKEFKINDISRLLNSFSIVNDGLIYVVKIDTSNVHNLEIKNNFDENSLRSFVMNTNITDDEMVNMCYMILKNSKCIENKELTKIIIDKVEKSGICNNNRTNLKCTMASLLGTLVKKELTTDKHTENINDIIEFYYQRYFNSVA